MIALIISLVLYKPLKEYYKNKENQFYFSDTNVSIIGFYAKLVDAVNQYTVYKADSLTSIDIEPTWEILESKPQYSNYILVIGESMRADYTSMYGYSIDTTPFLANTKGILFSNYISTAGNTQPSLLRTLYRNKEPINYQDNIITLAKKAGFKTYWISNQGKVGKYDTVASRVGIDADEVFFTKKGDFDFINVNDTVLVDVLSEYVKKDKTEKRLFVLHLMGSHFKFCSRLPVIPKVYFINQNMSCYLETLKQTDSILNKIVNIFKDEKDYSLIYFSDHGMHHNHKNTQDVVLDIGQKYKQNYRVPFIKISSDDITREELDTYRSAFYFMSGYAQWLGIKEKDLMHYNYFFTNKQDMNIKVFNGHQLIEFDSLPEDPLITK